MPKLLWTYAGRLAFSVACSIVGALIVSKLGLLHPQPATKLEKIVFDQSDLTRFDDFAQRVEGGHVAIRELKAAQEAEARRNAATATRKDAIGEDKSPSQARILTHPAGSQDNRKSTAPRREMVFVTEKTEALPAPERTETLAPPLVIIPTHLADGRPSREGLEGAFDKLTAGVAKIRDFVVNATRIEKPVPLPFGSTSTASDSLLAIDELRSRLKLPAFDL